MHINSSITIHHSLFLPILLLSFRDDYESIFPTGRGAPHTTFETLNMIQEFLIDESSA
jgi:hypothetical protein